MIEFWFYDGEVPLTGKHIKSQFTAAEALEHYKEWKNESPQYKPLPKRL